MTLSPYMLSRQAKAMGKTSAEPPKEKKPIPKRSEKMKGVIARLKKAYALFLSNPKNKHCKVKIDDNCTKVATVVHHTKGRDPNTIENEKYWLPSCSHCNIELENKDGLAREKGVKISRHSIPDSSQIPEDDPDDMP